MKSWVRLATLMLALSLGSLGSASAQQQQQPPPLKPLSTRLTEFPITFALPASTDPNAQPAEAQLFVATGKAANWQLYARQRPQAKSFQFKAPNDGDYWFTVRAVDRNGTPIPNTPLKPELHVRVDTAAPKLELVTELGSSGEIRASWRAIDENLLPSSFQLLSRATPDAEWQMPLEIKNLTAQNGMFERSVSWQPKSKTGTIEIQAVVRDTAGNSTFISRQVDLSMPRLPDPISQPVPPANDVVDRQHAPNVPPPEAYDGPISWPATKASDKALDLANTRDKTPKRRPLADANRKFQDIASLSSDSSPITSDPAALAGAPQTSTIAKSVSRKIEPDQPIPGGIPEGESPYMTRQKQFQLDYEVDTIGSSGVAQVELWGTADGGRSWSRWGIDRDRRSPFPVQVNEDGIFGFRIIVRNGAGLAGKPPESGDPAEMWVGVDTQAPNVRITSAIYGSGVQAGDLAIHWEANDPKLTREPINLYFSDQPKGPWTVIAAGLPNNKRYHWRVDHRLPRQIYLRIEARDEAGNVGTHQLTEPIANEGVPPRARIRGVEELSR